MYGGIPEDFRQPLGPLFLNGVEHLLDGILRHDDPGNHPLVELQVSEEPLQEFLDRTLEFSSRLGLVEKPAQSLSRERQVTRDRPLHRADQADRQDFLEILAGPQQADRGALDVVGHRVREIVTFHDTVEPLFDGGLNSDTSSRSENSRDRFVCNRIDKVPGPQQHRFLEALRRHVQGQLLHACPDSVIDELFDVHAYRRWDELPQRASLSMEDLVDDDPESMVEGFPEFGVGERVRQVIRGQKAVSDRSADRRGETRLILWHGSVQKLHRPASKQPRRVIGMKEHPDSDRVRQPTGQCTEPDRQESE